MQNYNFIYEVRMTLATMKLKYIFTNEVLIQLHKKVLNGLHK